VPPFSCRGPELDISAPGVAIIACQSPDGYAICDGTSLAAAHVTALAALILARHSDFTGSFARRDFQRVERLFQILKDTAQSIGHPWQTGAGLPDAARALGVWSGRRPLAAPLDAGLGEMRNAIRHLRSRLLWRERGEHIRAATGSSHCQALATEPNSIDVLGCERCGGGCARTQGSDDAGGSVRRPLVVLRLTRFLRRTDSQARPGDAVLMARGRG